MHLVFRKTHGSLWSVALVVPGQGLALTSQEVRTEQEEIQQHREKNTEHFGAETTIEVENKNDDDAPSNKEDADDTESTDDGGEDGDERGEDRGEKNGEKKDEVGQADKEDGEEEDDYLENGREDRQVSALAIIVSSQKIIETANFIIDEETWRTFDNMLPEEKPTTLAGLAFRFIICLTVIGFVLWVMVQAFESVTVTVE